MWRARPGAVVRVTGDVFDERSAVAVRATATQDRVKGIKRFARQLAHGELAKQGRMWLRM
jgi:hypothetical protein